ncbi:MAG TPA: BamA/TamA family outer membrane protein [Thermoanaerobaculia bacterium]|nr:BamA/TamA family outer membrane protein [Thermoanaerobaculia bacterium]
MRNAARLSLAVLLVFSLAGTANAQYFGRNKVQWESFDFKTLKTDHFDIYYYDQEADVVKDVGRQAERWYVRLSKVFGHEFKRKPIVLYANAADFHQTTTTGGVIGEGTGGFTDAFMNRVVLPLTGTYAENDHVLGHEIVHVFQYDMAAQQAKDRRRFNLEALPLWLVEGMAEYFSKGRIDPLTSMWIRDATINDRLPDLRKLSRDPRYFPYRYGEALMAYIGARFGDDAVVRYFLASGIVGVDEAIERSLGISSKQLFTDWNESARELYNPVLQSRPESFTKPLIGRAVERDKEKRKKADRRRGSELNIGPVLSPDGRYIAFLSTRELFSVDLYLADAKTGNVIRKLVSSDVDSHIESLRFIESAGAWSPDATRLAFITFEKGDNFLTIVDVNTRNLEHIKVPGLEAIANAAWSPDGHTIAVSGQVTGVSDLFLYDLDTKQVRRLTNDKFADLQPAWSPDGKTLAFVTDRAAAEQLNQLAFNELRIATIDVSTGAIYEIPLFQNTKHINPQYGPDGNIYFIANPEGIPDIYRYNAEGGAVMRVTAVQTGVAGITDLSPAMTVAEKTGDIAFSLFEDDNYNIYSIAGPAPAVATSTTMPAGTPRASILPPLRATGSAITAYLSKPSEGLPPADTQFAETGYNPDLHLAYLGPPTLGVGTTEFGFAAGGSVTAYFSDILGQQNVGFTFQGGGYGSSNIADQLGGEVFYLNQKNRLNWGADLVRVPYISVGTAFFPPEPVTIDGQTFLADVLGEVRQTETVTDVTALTQYPFSTTRRVEAAAGIEQYSFKQELEKFFFVGNTIVGSQRTDLGNNFSFNLWKASAAFVGDSSVYGFISPINGTRYRYEVETLGGDLKFSTALADWRKYFFKRPVTLAIRGLHYGRYGSDAESTEISPLYIGQGSVARGYDPYTVNVDECESATKCSVYDRLIGSKIAAASVEVRAPLLGVEGFGLINASFLPTEAFAFVDAGAAWSRNDSISVKWATRTDERVPVFSAGIGLRILLAYIPIEIFAAKPFQRPDEQIVYGFNLIPGW